MAVGVQVLNDRGNFQIDDTYRNLALVQAGRIGGNIDFTVGQDALIAFRPDIGAICEVQGVQKGVATKTVKVSASGGVQVYIFDYGSPRGSSTGGLEIFTSGGLLAYSSFYDYLKVVEMWADPDQYTPYRPGAVGDGQVTCYPDIGRQLALAPTNMSRGTNIQPTGDGFNVDEYYTGHWITRAGTGVGIQYYEALRAANVGDSGAGTRYPWFGGLFVDVTGFPGSV